jgi:putative oxidoreductase
MNSKVFLALRIIFGIFLLIFGSNKFLNFMPAPDDMPEAVMTVFTALTSTKTIILVGAVEILSGLSLIFNKYGALMMIILMSVSVNAVLFHINVAPDTVAGAAVLLILNLVMLYGYRDAYKPLLKG